MEELWHLKHLLVEDKVQGKNKIIKINQVNIKSMRILHQIFSHFKNHKINPKYTMLRLNKIRMMVKLIIYKKEK